LERLIATEKCPLTLISYINFNFFAEPAQQKILRQTAAHLLLVDFKQNVIDCNDFTLDAFEALLNHLHPLFSEMDMSAERALSGEIRGRNANNPSHLPTSEVSGQLEFFSILKNDVEMLATVCCDETLSRAVENSQFFLPRLVALRRHYDEIAAMLELPSLQIDMSVVEEDDKIAQKVAEEERLRATAADREMAMRMEQEQAQLQPPAVPLEVEGDEELERAIRLSLQPVEVEQPQVPAEAGEDEEIERAMRLSLQAIEAGIVEGEEEFELAIRLSLEEAQNEQLAAAVSDADVELAMQLSTQPSQEDLLQIFSRQRPGL